MSRLYTSFLLLLSAGLILIFHYSNVKLLWNVDIEHTGNYYQETFIYKQNQSQSDNLTAVGGKTLIATPQKVLYHFNIPPNTSVYLRPVIRDKNTAFFVGSEAYKDLKTIQIALPTQKHFNTVFSVDNGFPDKIDITPYIKESSAFRLLLDDQGKHKGDRVIRSMEIFFLPQSKLAQFPDVPLFFLFLIVPILWMWFMTNTVQFHIATALGLSVSALVSLHILAIVETETVKILLWCSAIMCALLILIDHLIIRRQRLPLAPVFWLFALAGLTLRWQEVLWQSSVPLHLLSEQQDIFRSAVLMDLFSPLGFYSSHFSHAPLYILFTKLTGQFFGFSSFHLRYVSFAFSVLLIYLVYQIGNRSFQNHWISLLAATILTFNELLIHESALGLPWGLEACIFILFLYYAAIKKAHSPMVWGIWTGLLAGLWCLTHSGFFLLVLLLMLIGMIWQIIGHQSWNLKTGGKGLIIAYALSLLMFGPHLYSNLIAKGDAFAEVTQHISRVANLEFATKRESFPELQDYPTLTDVIKYGEKAENYQFVKATDYFFGYHETEELLAFPFLGYAGICIDIMGALLNTFDEQTYWVQKMLSEYFHVFRTEPLLSALVVFQGLLFIVVVLFLAWNLSYRILLAFALLAVFPHTFFYGVLLLKSVSVYLLYRYQSLIYILPIFAWGLSALLLKMAHHYRVILK